LRVSSIPTSVQIQKCVEKLRIKSVLILAQISLYRCKNRANADNYLDDMEYQQDTTTVWYGENIDNYVIVKQIT
jgi:hypothetical protein